MPTADTNADLPRDPGYLVRMAREKVKLNQTDFATELDVSQQTVSRWESGHIRVPVKYVDAITKVAGLDGPERGMLLEAVAYAAACPTSEYGSDREEMKAKLQANEAGIAQVRESVEELAGMMRTLTDMLAARKTE